MVTRSSTKPMPTRRQLAAVNRAAERAHSWSTELTYLRTTGHDDLLSTHLNAVWRAYFALGEALRETGTEQQPAEGAHMEPKCGVVAETCDAPAAWRYRAMGGGYMHMCEAHGQKHASISEH